MELSVVSILVFGFLLGLKHAVEVDHLVAVSTIVAERKNIFSSAIIGGFWGVGHTIALFIACATVIFLKFQISESLEAKLETLVGIMLVLLGLNALRKLWQKEKIHFHSHEHDGYQHTHLHTHQNEEAEEAHHFMKFSPRPVFVGMIHGLAGSAGLMLLIVPTITSTFFVLLYILTFGVGSIGGMMLMSLILGLPIHLTSGNFQLLNKLVLGVAGVFSFGLGVFIVFEKVA